MTKARDTQHETGVHKDFFYFDLSDEGHEKLLEHELREAKQNPLEPLEEVTRIEY